MRNKKEFIFNEKEYAEKIIEEGFENGILDYSKIYTVAKYFREQYGYGEKVLEKKIIEFCIKHDKNFNPIVEAGAIHKWVKSAMKYGLRKIDHVVISEKDVEFLKTIKNSKDRKVLFATMIFSKSLKQASTKRKKSTRAPSDNFYVHYNNILDISRISNINGLTELGLVKIYNKYPEYITFLHPERELIKLEYVDKNVDTKVVIKNLWDISESYEKLFDDFHKCAVCGEKLIKTSGNQIYCKECAKTKRTEQQRILMRERRNGKSRDL